jgi:hypothetical protein
MRLVSKLVGWLELDDYKVAKRAATRKIVARLARGNVAMQNGWYLTHDGLDKLKAEGDVAMKRLLQRKL